jgi:hypothetical protein
MMMQQQRRHFCVFHYDLLRDHCLQDGALQQLTMDQAMCSKRKVNTRQRDTHREEEIQMKHKQDEYSVYPYKLLYHEANSVHIIDTAEFIYPPFNQNGHDKHIPFNSLYTSVLIYINCKLFFLTPRASACAIPNCGTFFDQSGLKCEERQILPPRYILTVLPSNSGNTISKGETG